MHRLSLQPFTATSLPSRERGLKYKWGLSRLLDTESLPSRERGLKFCQSAHCKSAHKSLPSRERGLKCIINYRSVYARAVAPFAGAWIEIVNTRSASSTASQVAPFAGAWIEIFVQLTVFIDRSLSLPSRERGLK